MNDNLEDLLAVPPVEEDEPELISAAELDQKLRDERKEMTIRALRHRADMWTQAFATDDAFKELVAEFRAKKAKMKKYWFDRFQLGIAVEQREIDYQRGYLDGLGYLDTLLQASANFLAKIDAQAQSPQTDDDEGEGWGEWPTTTP